jgi:peroxiredoxin
VFGGVLASVSACGVEPAGNQPATPTNSALGAAAPDFTARDTSGETFRLSEHLGKEVILLDFWATYCEPCKAAFPHVESMSKALKAKGLLVVGVAMDGPDTVADVASFKARYNLTFPVVLDEDSRIASLYNPKKAMPLSVVIDRSGKVVKVREGFNPGDEDLIEADLKKALDSHPPAP